MPELPEVETIARGVHARVRGDRIVEVWFASHREPFKNAGGPAGPRPYKAASSSPFIAPASTSSSNWGLPAAAL